MRQIISAVLLTLAILPNLYTNAQEKQVLEVRTYTLVDATAEATLDRYLADALVPALKRQGLGPIGVFDEAPVPNSSGQSGEIFPKVMVLIAGPTSEAVTTASIRLAADGEYMKAAKEYLAVPSDKPIVKRINSELLVSFNCWPKVTVPKQSETQEPRLFELRIYESATENLGNLKVEMFNSGEVPIFLDCGIQPVFMGQAVVGDKMPNLTYMTVYDNAEIRDECWKKFVAHPDWQVLKSVQKYQGTVSTIHKSDWLPKAYSEL